MPYYPSKSEAVCRILHRPSASTAVSRVIDEPVPTATTFSTLVSHFRSPATLDMPTGTGETITALLGSIRLAIERKSDIEKAQPDGITAVYGTTSDVPGRLEGYPGVPGTSIYGRAGKVPVVSTGYWQVHRLHPSSLSSALT